MKNILFLGLTIASMSIVSCSGFLTEEPILTQSNELTLSNYTGLNKAVLGTYAPMCSANWYGANFVLASELRGGNAKNPTNTAFTSGRYTTEYTWSYNSGVTSPVWGTAYYVISMANNVINNIVGKSDAPAQDYANLKAECLFLRSLAYFDLVRTYGQPYTSAPNSLGVSIVLESKVDNKPARNTVKEVYEDRILVDLLEAEQIMSDDYTRKEVKDVTSIVSKPAIHALLSRVYLYMGRWQESADYATKVINNKSFSMWSAAEFGDVWGVDLPKKGGEVIFEVYQATGNSYDGFWDNIANMVKPTGYPDVASTKDIRDMFETKDLRSKLWVSHPDATDHFWTLKYPGKGLRTPDVNNVVVLRLSEMYLNRAEAIYKGASIAGVTALDDLNKITTARGATAYSSPDAESIFNERRKELCFEGHIVYDLARLGRALKRTDYDGDRNQNIDFPNYRWALPIPKREMDANLNMEPNPGY